MRQLRISDAHRQLMRSVRFGRRQVGIEFTTIPPSLFTGNDYDEEAEEPFKDLIGHDLIQDVHGDPGCIEIPSNVLTGWRKVIQFYSLVTRRAVAEGCVQDSPHSTGGGGHIHISARSWENEWDVYGYVMDRTRALTSYITERPWIAWAFNDPSDNTEAVVGRPRGANEPAVRFANTKDNVEFRFFDSAEDINEQIEHVAFALKLLDVQATARPLPLRRQRIPLTAALEGWETTIRELGLPWSLYKRYTKNIRDRYEFGPRYLN